jgi:hypothetical protein
MAYTGKATFNIDRTTIHSSLFIPLNCKDLPYLSLKQLDSLVLEYNEISLIRKMILYFIDF